MDQISPKERLLRKLYKKEVDRNPVICPGGMMNAAIVDVMKERGHILPEAHSDYELMNHKCSEIDQLKQKIDEDLELLIELEG